MATLKDLEDRLVSAGVKNLRDTGYPDCNPTNIFTDYIYSAFFKSMLEGTIEDAPPSAESIRLACRRLIERIKPIPLKEVSAKKRTQRVSRASAKPKK